MKKIYLTTIGILFFVAASYGQTDIFYIGNNLWNGSGSISNWNSAATLLGDINANLSNNSTFLHGEDISTFNGAYTSSGIDIYASRSEYGNNSASTQKTIAGTNAPSFAKLQTSADIGNIDLNITNTNGIIITGTLETQFRYIITNRNNALAGAVHFQGNAGYTFTPSNTMFIDGYAHTNAVSSFTYPVGAGGKYRPLTTEGVTTSTGGSSNITVAWMPDDPGTTANHSVTSVGFGVASVSTAGQWDWATTDDLTGNVTVSIPDMTVFSPSGSTYLRLVGWDGAKWVNLSTVTHATGTTENSLLYGRVVPGITALGIGKGLAPLPVTMEYFNGTANGCSAVLTWKTAVEENVKHFEVQYSLNGKDFHTVGQVAAGAATKTYSYTNEQNGGTGYYQLKTVDANGTYGYSPVVSVQTTCAETNVVVFPNPVKDYVKIKGVQAGTSIYVVNTAGQTVLRTTASDSGVQLLNTQRLAPGAYIIVTEKNNQRQQFKIVKQAN